MQEAEAKIQSFDVLKADFEVTIRERDELIKANSFLELKLTQNAQILGHVEEGRRNDSSEVQNMKEQMQMFQKEYQFYKNRAQQLEVKTGGELENLNAKLREITEKEKDSRIRVAELEQENLQLVSQNRNLMTDMSRQQRELKQIMAINEEYQVQANSFRERETQFTELSREYKDKLELIKFEREKLALKEEQFVRQIHKAESTQKQETAKQAQIYESKMQTRQRDMNRAVEDLEDKMNSALDEAEEMRAKADKLEKLNQAQKLSLEEKQRKEDRLILQYDKLLEQLRAEIKEKERELHAEETRGAYAKQEVLKNMQEVELKLEFQAEKLHSKESEYLVLKSDMDKMKEQNLMLKAAIKEGDKTREILARQMTVAMQQEL